MLDTVKLESPPLSEAQAAALERLCVRRLGVDVGTGEVLWEFTAGQLGGSYDHRTSLRVERERWEMPAADDAGRPSWRFERRGPRPKRHPVRVPCAPYAIVEGSVHKALVGHNIEGGPIDVAPACRWYVGELARQAGCELPPAGDWLVRRVDWREVFDLGDQDAVAEWIAGLQLARFPRRSPDRFGDQTWMAVGDSTTVKAYHKGPEFVAHDFGRLARSMGIKHAHELRLRARSILVVEVEIRASKLDREAWDEKRGGERPTVAGISTEWCCRVYDHEMARLLREGREMETVRTHRAVKRRLDEVYGGELANRLFGSWLQFAALGEQFARGQTARRTFYRHRQQLQAAGVSWVGADVQVDERARLVPADFAPLRSDPRRMTGEDSRITAQLARYRAA